MDIDWFPLWLSLRVAAVSTLLAFAGGLALAYLLANYSLSAGGISWMRL